MGWAEMRIQQYNQGEKANWWERKLLEHANPVNIGFHVLGGILLIYGLWTHHWGFILIGVLLNNMGHVYCRLKKNGYDRED